MSRTAFICSRCGEIVRYPKERMEIRTEARCVDDDSRYRTRKEFDACRACVDAFFGARVSRQGVLL